jgi:uncharacterized protein (TIGR03083 family)
MDYLRSIRDEGELFYATAGAADPAIGVPSTPGWTIADLTWHLGEVHWFWASDVELRATDPDEVEANKPSRPQPFADLVGWGRAQLDRMIGILESTPDEVPVWTWASDESAHSVGFVRRHQVQETAVHRWDMQGAATSGIPDPIDGEAASDSIDEFLWSTLPWGVNHSKPLRGSVHLHATDVEGEWFIEPNGRVDRAHAKGDVAVRGTASDLLLALYNRVPIDGLDVVGDTLLARDLVKRVEGT